MTDGLASERTREAWARTALAALVYPIVLVRSAEGRAWPVAALAVLAMVAAGALSVLCGVRTRRLANGAVGPLAPSVGLGITVVTALFAAATVGVVAT